MSLSNTFSPPRTLYNPLDVTMKYARGVYLHAFLTLKMKICFGALMKQREQVLLGHCTWATFVALISINVQMLRCVWLAQEIPGWVQ